MKCEKMQGKYKVNLQLKNKKKQKLKEKGITLIALVVTIIILLILAGVTLNMALSGDGLFNMARKAATDYNEKSVEEKLQILYAEKVMEDNDSNTKVKTDVTDVLEEMAGGEITEENIEEFNKLLEQYNEKVKGIKTAEELGKIGTENDYPIDGVYVQLSDIEQLSNSIGTVEKPFKGIYNGNGKSIKKLEITASEDYTGMFRVNEGTVKNVTIKNCQITSGKGIVGGIAGENKGLIKNCSVSEGNITSNGCFLEEGQNVGSRVGGICGQNTTEGLIFECKNSTFVTGLSQWAGGICGYNCSGNINKCFNDGSVAGSFGVGGIAGLSEDLNETDLCEVIDCINNGMVEGKGKYDGKDTSCGGIVGLVRYESNIKDCENNGIVRGVGSCVGGVGGCCCRNAIVYGCVNRGSVSRT